MKRFLTCCLMLCAATLMACSGDGGPVVQNANLSAASAAAATTVTGRATKGPLDRATIELFDVDARGRPIGAPRASVQTDAAGNWSADLAQPHNGLLVRARGGRFVDESDPDQITPRSIQLAANDELLSFLPANEQTVSITLLSHALVNKARLETGANNFAAMLAANRSQFTRVLGLDPLVTTAADPLAPQGGANERRFALIVGGMAYALNSLAIEQGRAMADYPTIALLIADLVDCRVDGYGIAGTPLYAAGALDGVTLNASILRFRNNHFAAYAGVPVPILDSSGCPVTPGSRDTVAPVFAQTPGASVVPALNAQGTPSDAPAVTAAVAQFVATDDRDATPRVTALLPAQLALGLTAVNVEAVDAWGNVTTTVWSVEVRDITPPSLTPPPDISVAATAVRTAVVLGVPQVQDNVTATAALALSNDAPDAGFAVGDTAVTWAVVDAAGLRTSAVQTVTVVGAAPALLGPLPPLFVASGSNVDVNLPAYFADPFDAPLSFSVAGLPAGSGLAVDPVTGRLTGVAGAAELAASPFTLTVTAANVQFSQSASLSVTVAPAVPAFTLSSSSVNLVEDFPGLAMVSINGPALPPGTVTYAWSEDAGSDGVVVAQFSAAEGVFAFSAIANANGVSRFTVEAINTLNGARFSAPLTVTVAPVNDAPMALVSDEVLSLQAQTIVDLDLSARFTDVDDSVLSYALSGAPRSLNLSAAGQLTGTPTPVDAAGGQFIATVTATDPAGASGTATLRITVTETDTDGDGLSDAREAQLGTNPAAPDSDGDGVDDATEVRAGADPLLGATAVIYLSTDGANSNGGSSFADALRDHDGLTNIPPGVSPQQPTFILYATGPDVYAGTLALTPPCDNIVLAGSLDPLRNVPVTGTNRSPTSTLTNSDAPSVTLAGCAETRITYLTIAGSRRGGIVGSGGSLALDDVHMRNNLTDSDGGAVQAVAMPVRVTGGVYSGNLAGGSGAAFAVSGAGGALTMRHTVLNGNGAAGSGGAVYFSSADGVLDIFNVLVTANAASAGAGIYVDQASAATIANATIAFNQRQQLGSGAALAAVNPALVQLRDSVVVANVDSVGASSALPVTLAGNFNSIDQPAIGSEDLTIDVAQQAFGQRFALTAGALAVDRGSTTAITAGLADRFAISDTPYADDGQLDRGYHYPRGVSEPALTGNSLSGALTRSGERTARFARYRPLVIHPRRSGQPLGAGHRVRLAALNGRNDLINVVRLFDPVTSGDVYATDLGDGRYQVWLDERSAAATRFRLTVDGVVAQDEPVFLCALNACQGASPLLPGPP